MTSQRNTKKGIGLISLVFVVLAVVFGGVLWYQFNILGGVGISEEILEESKHEKTGYEFGNSLTFLDEALGDSATNASQTVSDHGGRNGTNFTQRYWRCDRKKVMNSGREVIKQIPNSTRVLLSLQNKTMQYMNEWLKELHGIRGEVTYEPGELKCAEVGYKEPRNSPENDKFKTGAEIGGLNVSYENYKRSRTNITPSDLVKYNRFWYMYEEIKDWAEETISNRKMYNNIKSNLATIPDYIDASFCGQCCPCPFQKGCEEIPANWSKYIHEEVSKGINTSIYELENSKDFFNKTQADCTYNIVQRFYQNIPILTNPCEENDCDGDGYKEPESYCRLDYAYFVELDVEVICSDEKFRSIPRDDLERLRWIIRFNIEAKDMPNGIRYDWYYAEDPSLSKLEQSPSKEGHKNFPECEIGEENPELCETPVKVKGELSED